MVDLQVLGYDPKRRLIVLETAGNRDGGQTYRIQAIRDGKTVVSRQILGPGELLPVRMATLLADGSVCYLRLDSISRNTLLYKVGL